MPLGEERMTLLIIKSEEICAGDVFLCYSAMMETEDNDGGSGYSHVAISIDGEKILESNSTGVKLTSVSALLEEYNHIAVMRNSELWCLERMALLSTFADISIGKNFNRAGMRRYPDCKAAYQNTAMDRLHGYFDGTEPDVETNRETYFCSELVTAAFIYVGIIDKSAAVIFTPETFSPKDIRMDKVFGFFNGYLIAYPEYEIPETDYFRSSV